MSRRSAGPLRGADGFGVRLIESVFAEHAETIELAMRGLGETEQRALADRLRTLGTYAAGRLGVPLDPV